MVRGRAPGDSAITGRGRPRTIALIRRTPPAVPLGATSELVQRRSPSGNVTDVTDLQPEPQSEPGGRPHDPVDDVALDPPPDRRSRSDSDAAAEDPGTPDLEAIERDLSSVEAALVRLDDGSYWTDEVTGEQIPDSVLADDPIARRA